MMNGLNSDTLILIKEQFGEFDIKQVMGGSNDVYLRFGYWRKVNIGKLQELIGLCQVKNREFSLITDMVHRL